MTDTLEIPHSREAEEAVIGAVLIDPEIHTELSEFLCGNDFSIHRLGMIWNAFDQLSKHHQPIDILTVSEKLESLGHLGEVGGPAILTALLNQVPSTLNAPAYGRIVHETYVRRRMIAAANKIATLAYDQSRSLDESAEGSVRALEEAVMDSIGDGLVPFSQLLADAYDRLDQLSRTTELPGVPTGLAGLDLKLGNLHAGTLNILAARPGQGKTALLLSIARNAAVQGKRVAVFSLEMSREQITNRLLAQESGVNLQLIDTGKFGSEEWGRVTAAIEKREKLPILVDDTSAITPLQIKAKCRRWHLHYGMPDLVIVDYIQLMKSGEKHENRSQEVGAISRALKALSKELNIPVLAAAQLNRDVEQRADKRPQLSDLRESGDLEQDADVVMFLHQPDPVAANGIQPTEIIVAKHRNGPLGSVNALFHRSITKFEGATKLTL